MIDESLRDEIREKRPLRRLYLDMNAYFASVEQAEDPSLRGRPIAVAPLEADTTFIIAASVEAKRHGVKTGHMVGDAKARLPELLIVPARPPLYVHYHRRIIEVVEDVLPVLKVCSIDEMKFGLIGRETHPENAREIGLRMKAAVREGVAENLTCSVGIAPNSFVAKIATDLQKPDGMIVIQAHELPNRLEGMRLTEFPGINKKMEVRLKAAGIFSGADLIRRSEKELEYAFGSITGLRWWHLLRGVELKEEESLQKSLSHSHVLPPELRTDQGARDVLLRLAAKASARLRSNGLWAETMGIFVKGRERSWKASAHLDSSQDTFAITQKILDLWKSRDFSSPYMTGLAFGDLKPIEHVTPSLFADHDRSHAQQAASKALDALNQKFGKNTVFLASIEAVKGSATEKIAFNKTWLFDEGKDDNDGAGTTFRGLKR
jgi:DNA polymerase IV